MAERDQKTGSFSGLTDSEAKSFHSLFMGSFFFFTVIAIVAHILVWMWRPWFPGVGGYAEVQEGATKLASLIAPIFG